MALLFILWLLGIFLGSYLTYYKLDPFKWDKKNKQVKLRMIGGPAGGLILIYQFGVKDVREPPWHRYKNPAYNAGNYYRVIYHKGNRIKELSS